MTSRRLRLTAAQLVVAILVATVALPSPTMARSADGASAPSGQRDASYASPNQVDSAVVPAPGPDEESLTGVLQVATADDFRARVSTTYIWLDTDEGPVPLALSGRAAERFAGSRVTVVGRRRPDGTLSASSDRVYPRGSVPSSGTSRSGSAPWDEAAPLASSQNGEPSATAVQTRKIAVIVARYSDQSGYPVTLSQAQDTFYNDATASVQKYWEAATRGRVTTTTTVYGQWNLGIAQCSGGVSSWNFQATINAANSAATAHGVSLSSFDHVVIWTKQPCNQEFLGVGMLPGKWIQSTIDWAVYPGDQPATSAMVASHEMGHNLGLYHSQGLLCFDGSSNQVPLNGNCGSASYWDEYTTMGMVGSPIHALLDADRLQSKGWLDSGEWQTPTSVGTYSLVPTYSATPGVRLLRIPRLPTVVPGGETGAWTIEIRSTLTGTAWDQFVPVLPWYPDLAEPTTGISIRYSEDQYRQSGSLGYSYLVDTSADGTPSEFDFFDAPLQAGETFADTTGGFTFYVASVSGSGATVTIGDTKSPTVPLALEGVAIPAGGAELNWQPASDNLGLGGYRIYRGAVQIGEVSASTLTFTDPPAGLGGPVTYSVRAFDTADNLGPAATANVTLTAPPGAPTAATAAAGNSAALVSWTAPAPNGAPAPTSYTATSSPGGLTCTVAAPATSCVVEGLSNGTPYTFTVVATNSVGDGPASSPSNSVTPSSLLPGRPTDVVGTPGEGAASVTWQAPADHGGSAITNYTVTIQPGGTTCTTLAMNCVFMDLTNGVAYTFTAVATNDDGDSVPSEPSAPVTPRTHPDPPVNVVALGLDGAARVSWDAGPDGGSPVTAYDVVSNPGGYTCHTAGARVCTVSGLTNRTWYTFTVTATNVAGTSDPSAASPQAMPLAGATYKTVTPNRILDSRNGTGGISTKISHNTPVSFTVVGQVPGDATKNVPAGAVAVTGNLTVTNATRLGYFVLTPEQPTGPLTTSTLNFQAGVNTANGVTVPLGPGGVLWVTYFAKPGATADVIFDVTGYYTMG